MRMRGRWLVALGVLLATFIMGAAAAASGVAVFPIPGVVAAHLAFAGVSRLDDGGAVIAASLAGRGPDSWQPIIARVLVDGTVDLAYGNEGVASPSLGSDVRATALAIDPRNGDAWVAVSVGPHHRGAILALDGDGTRRRSFGDRGIMSLGSAGPPVALAWRGGELVIASGGDPCAGCALAVVDSQSGRTLATGRMGARLPAAAQCVGGTVTGVTLVGAQTLLVASSQRRHCAAELATMIVSRHAGRRVLETTAATTLAPGLSHALIGIFGPNVCVSGWSAKTTELGPFDARHETFRPDRAPRGRPIAVVALGGGACAALIAESGRSRAVVVQVSAHPRSPATDLVPRRVVPLGMFRCHGHMLVIGSQGHGRERAAVIAVIPVRRGPNALTAAASVAGGGNTRCT